MSALPPPTLPATAPSSTYTCPYCRLQGDATGASCPHCGAPVDIRAKISESGWEPQPAIKDMARIQFGQSTCQISGAYVPSAEMRLGANDSIYFSHHVMLWADTQVRIGAQSMKGGWTRMMGGLPLIMMEAHGPGGIALSENHPGEMIAVPLTPGRSVNVREHRFLMATGNIAYDYFRSGVWYKTRNGDETETHYPSGMYLDHFVAQGQPGLLLIHAPGNVFVRDLAVGQSITLHAGAMVWTDSSVSMSLHLERPLSAGSSWLTRWQPATPWLRLTGPGRIAMSSVFPHLEGTGRIISTSPATSTDWNRIGIRTQQAQPQPQAQMQAGYGGGPVPLGATTLTAVGSDPLAAALGPALAGFAASQNFQPEAGRDGPPAQVLFRFAHPSGIRIAVEVAPPGTVISNAPGQAVGGLGDTAIWRQEGNGFGLEVRKGPRAIDVHVTGPIPPPDQYGWAQAFAAQALSLM